MAEPDGAEHGGQQAEAQERQHQRECRAQDREQGPAVVPQDRYAADKPAFGTHAEEAGLDKGQRASGKEQDEGPKRAAQRSRDAASSGEFEIGAAQPAHRLAGR
jgi:hypothetical protein